MINLGAKLYDTQLIKSAGLPLPKNAADNTPAAATLFDETKRALEVVDEQNAINRYRWYNLPLNLTSQELEKLLYIRGQLYLFYYEPLEQFFVMPGAMVGSIDFYERPNYIKPVPFANGTTDEEKEIYKRQEALLSGLKLKVYYTMPLNDLTYEETINACVPIFDYTPRYNQNGMIPRCDLQNPFIDTMAKTYCYMDTAMKNSVGTMTMAVNTEDEASNVAAANATADRAALTGQRYVAISGTVSTPDVLSPGSVANADQYLQTMQAQDNLRLSMLGLDNGGIFQKKARMITAEQAARGNVESTLNDGLLQRANAALTANVIWGTTILCEISESAANADMNLDGMAASNDAPINEVM